MRFVIIDMLWSHLRLEIGNNFFQNKLDQYLLIEQSRLFLLLYMFVLFSRPLVLLHLIQQIYLLHTHMLLQYLRLLLLHHNHGMFFYILSSLGIIFAFFCVSFLFFLMLFYFCVYVLLFSLTSHLFS